MHTRVLGAGSLEVSALRLGCMSLSHGYGRPTAPARVRQRRSLL